MVKSKKETKKTKEPDGLETLRKELWMDSLPDKLPFRDEELDKIYEFCQLFIERKDESYSLYLGGVPGTGKTSCVLQVCSFFKVSANKIYLYFRQSMS
jgi:Cdc6-like AAA superfamily ATPase